MKRFVESHRVVIACLAPLAVLGCGDPASSEPAAAQVEAPGAGGSGGVPGVVGGAPSGDGGSAPMVCEPGSSEPCYSGPEGTADVGLCKRGLRLCRADGSAWGECEGEVVPVVENCATTFDDDCNGLSNEHDAGCVCDIGEVTACYTGPSGTEGVGTCKPGTMTCSWDGKAWEPCMGEQLPQDEICGAPGDDDCDGFDCAETIWAKLAGDATYQGTNSVVTDGAGNVYATGTTDGSIDWGGGPTPATGQDAFLTKLDALGNHQWTKKFGGAGDQSGAAVLATDTDVYVAGTFSGTISLASQHTAPAGEIVGFVARFNANGAPVWSVALDYASSVTWITGLALDGAGGLAIVGATSSAADQNAFVHKLDAATGAAAWNAPKIVGDGSPQWGNSVACDSAGNIFVAGSFAGLMSFGQFLFTSGPTDTDAFVVKLDAAGNHIWSYQAAAAKYQYALTVAVDAAGAAYVAGSFEGTVNFGGGPVTSAGAHDGYVLKLSSGKGYVWSKSFGAAGDDGAIGVAVDGTDVALSGYVDGPVDIGGGLLSAFGSYDLVIAKLSAAQGAHVWSKQLGGSGSEFPSRVALGPSGGLAFGGTTDSDTISLGAGALPGAGGADAFVVLTAP